MNYDLDALENFDLFDEDSEKETEDGDTCCKQGCVCRQAT